MLIRSVHTALWAIWRLVSLSWKLMNFSWVSCSKRKCCKARPLFFFFRLGGHFRFWILEKFCWLNTLTQCEVSTRIAASHMKNSQSKASGMEEWFIHYLKDSTRRRAWRSIICGHFGNSFQKVAVCWEDARVFNLSDRGFHLLVEKFFFQKNLMLCGIIARGRQEQTDSVIITTLTPVESAFLVLSVVAASTKFLSHSRSTTMGTPQAYLFIALRREKWGQDEKHFPACFPSVKCNKN